MKKILFLFLFLLKSLLATNLMTYEVFDNASTIDITLSFDSAYEPNIFQKIDKNTLILTLKNVISSEKFTNQINSRVLSEFSIIPSNDNTKIIFPNGEALKIQALQGKDNLSLTLKIKNSNFIQSKLETQKEHTQNNIAQNNVGSNFDLVLYLILFCIFVLIVILLKNLFAKKQEKNINEWEIFDNLAPRFDHQSLKQAFKKDEFEDKNENLNQQIKKAQEKTIKEKNQNNEIQKNQNNEKVNAKIVLQKKLNNDNNLIVLELNEKKYILTFNNSDRIENYFNSDLIDLEELFEINKEKFNIIANRKNFLGNYIQKASAEFEEDR